MSKLIKIIWWIILGVLYSIMTLIMYIFSLIYLLLVDLIGTKKFNIKFKRLNQYLFDELQNTFNSVKDVFIK